MRMLGRARRACTEAAHGAGPVLSIGLLASAALGGCGGDARVEFSAADALTAVAGQMSGTLREYHHEVGGYDDSREAAAVAAFIARVRASAAEEEKLQAHASEFAAALRKIRQDREAEWQRQAAAQENVAVLREVAGGLQKLAIQSLSLQDEMRRYLTSWIDAQRRANGRVQPGAGPGQAEQAQATGSEKLAN